MENSKPNRNKCKKVQERRLKVFAKAHTRIEQNLIWDERIVFFPEIRIQGKWVQDCGFSINDRVLVTVKKNMIVIRKEDSL